MFAIGSAPKVGGGAFQCQRLSLSSSGALRSSDASSAPAVPVLLKVHRAPLPTATAPGVRSLRPIGASVHPTGSGAPAPTSAPPGARPQRRGRTSTSPTRSRDPAPTSTPPDVRPERPTHTYSHPTDSRSSEATSTPPGARRQRRAHNSPSTRPGLRDNNPENRGLHSSTIQLNSITFGRLLLIVWLVCGRLS